MASSAGPGGRASRAVCRDLGSQTLNSSTGGHHARHLLRARIACRARASRAAHMRPLLIALAAAVLAILGAVAGRILINERRVRGSRSRAG